MQLVMRPLLRYLKHSEKIPVEPPKLSVLVLALCASFFVSACSDPQQNRLALGERAKQTIALPIGINRPVDLNSKSKADVLGLRSYFVEQHKNLLAGAYKPSAEVFSEIMDGAAWYGLSGYFVHGKGAKCNLGRSVEARAILNPYLLVLPEFWGLTIWYKENVKWDRNKINAEALEQDDFPYYCAPESLEFFAQERKASVSYDLTSFVRLLNKYVTQELDPLDAYFGLSAYNARDLRLEYMYLDPVASSGISNPNDKGQAFPIGDRLQHNQKCGCAGGCNMMTAMMVPFNYIRVDKLPARVSIKLWEKKPQNISETADLTYEISLR